MEPSAVDEVVGKFIAGLHPLAEFRTGDSEINVKSWNSVEEADERSRDADVERLRQQLHSTQARSALNPFTKAVHVVHPEHSRGHEIVMAKFDTQSPPNLVCVDIVQRLGMEDMILPYEGPQYQGAGGETIETRGIVKLQWYDSTVAKSRWNEFLVTPPGSPFDLVLGWQRLKEEGVAAFQEPVLALRAMELTPGRFFQTSKASNHSS